MEKTKPVKRIYILLPIITLSVLLSSCSPKPISGQISVVTQAGANVSLGAIQVEVVSAHDADVYMNECKAEIDVKTGVFKEAYDKAKNARDAAAHAESQTPTAATKAQLALAEKKLNVAATALKNFPAANDYFEGFMPSTIETTMADVEGGFTIERPKQPAKVFAKAQRQIAGSVENYFWLIDVPPTGDKLILNNDNLFKVPRS